MPAVGERNARAGITDIASDAAGHLAGILGEPWPPWPSRERLSRCYRDRRQAQLLGLHLNVWTASSDPPTAGMMDRLNYAQREAQPSQCSGDLTNGEDTEVAFVLGTHMVKTAVGRL